MAYWLCDKRRAQDSTPLMRFDPRFWTVNFPRPAMASIISTGAESLRVDGVFYHSDELIGVIWDSVDHIDHPLLGYATNRDYRRLTLQFHWQSAGLLPLDAVNGPTLTIEGRDEAGAPKTWYIRLWNYASGNPDNAQITLDFSALSGGFLLPNEADPVYAGDIDRMFISVAPIGFDAAHTPFAAPVSGWVEMTQIRCDGAGVMLDYGDAMIPPHDLNMATGYDDCYNQTPARIIRQIHALGYRGSINHYVGMSHYFRLEPLYGGHYISLSGGAINGPCAAWHSNFAELARAMNFDVIFSLSYELLNVHCWNDWKQRAANGDPALTAWDSPSALLSPAHAGAMGYLQAVARAFVGILKNAGLPIQFQIGEPWWWIMPDGRICLYDDAMTAALGALSVPINTINGYKSTPQKNMLDRAGEILAASTAAIAAAVRSEASPANATVMLLAYLPTILSSAAPEAKRANLPLGWASPAFDILQLEDYEWAATGNQSGTANAIALVNTRLGYPPSKQHYFAGFVLDPSERAQWRAIELAARASILRGVEKTFVWALPQIARDGFTYFNIGENKEQSVQSFDDILFPISIGRLATLSQEFSTNIITTVSGHETRNSEWANARQHYDISPGLRSNAELDILLQFFRARRGPAIGFRFNDPFDNSSSGMTGIPNSLDQNLGMGDGVRTIFPLIKNYADSGSDSPQIRQITRPVADSILVAVNGIANANWTLLSGGQISFNNAPASGAIITAGYHFDVPVRFADDRISANRATFGAVDMHEILLVEIKE